MTAWNTLIPAMANQVTADIPDIKENLEKLYAMASPTNIWIPAREWKPTTTGGCAALANVELPTNDIQIEYLAFDGASEEFATHSRMMPENWDRGTIKAKFFYIPATGCTAADTVEWELAAVAVSNDDPIDATLGTGQVISDAITAGVEADLHVTGATPAITVGGTPALGDYVHFKMSRNVGGTDDMTEDAWLLGVMLQITANEEVTAW
jgi:hypothetical protein